MTYFDREFAEHMLRGFTFVVGCFGASLLICCGLGPALASWWKNRSQGR